MMELLKRYGGMLVAPRTTLRRIVAQDTGDLIDVIPLLIAIHLLAASRSVYRNALLLFEAPGPVSRRLLDTLWAGSQHLVVVAAVAALLLALAFRYAVQPRLHWRLAVAVVGYAFTPLFALALLGLILRAAGVELWWLPHTAPDNRFVVVVGGQVSWFRFLVKCAVSYGITALLLIDLVRSLRQQAQAQPAPEMTFPPQLVPDPGLKAIAGAMALALLLVMASIGAIADVMSARDWLRPALPGDALPTAKLPWLHKRGQLDLAALKGKVVVLDFWASWCAPCRRALPDLDRLSEDLRDQGLVVIGVNREPQNREAARAMLAKLKIHFRSVVDARANTQRGYGERLGLQSLPTTVLVDRKGTIRRLHLGYTDPAKVRAEVEKLLKRSLLEPIERSE